MARIKIQDYINEVESNRKKLIQHARANNVDVNDNISLSAITHINTQFANTEYEKYEEFVPETDIAREGPFDIIWLDLDGTELFKETVNKGGSATQFTGEPLLHKQFPDIITWDGWEYNGSLENVYRDVIVIPKYNIIPDEDGILWETFVLDIKEPNTQFTFPFKVNARSGMSVSSCKSYFNWGDGSEIESVTTDYNGSAKTLTHTYLNVGKYYVRFRCDINSTYYTLEINTSYYPAKESADLITNVFDIYHPYWYQKCSNITTFYTTTNTNVYGTNWNYIKVLNAKGNTSYRLPPNLKYFIDKKDTTSCNILLNSNLEYISIAESCTSVTIGYSTGVPSSEVHYKSVLKKLYIPNNVTYLYIANCNILNFTVPSKVNTLSVFGNPLLRYINFIGNIEGEITLGGSFCKYCKSLKGIKLPTNIFKLPAEAFLECTSLEQIILPSTITNLSGINNCYNLKYLYAPNILEIDKDTLKNCYDLLTLNIPECVTIKDNSFTNAYHLKSIYAPKLVFIGSSSFTTVYNLKDINIPLVEIINNNTFTYCLQIININVKNLKSIGSGCFINCYRLKELDFSLCNNLNYIAGGSFTNCYNLFNILLPKDISLTLGGNGSTNYCFTYANLKSFNINSQVTFENAFHYTNIQELNFNKSCNISNSFSYAIINVVNFDAPVSILKATTFNTHYIKALNFYYDSIINVNFSKMSQVEYLDASKCILNTALNLDMVNLNTLLLPNDFNYNLNISNTGIMDTLIDLVLNLPTVNTTLILSINSTQNNILNNNNLLELLQSKNWTVSVK